MAFSNANLKKSTEILPQVIDNPLSPVKYYPEPFVHRLSVELLQQIFLLVVDNGPDCPSIFSLQNKDEDDDDEEAMRECIVSANFAAPPLLFTRVCRLWRAVAHSTSGIWSRIQVDLPGGYEPLKPSIPSLLQFWLACSGNQPLTLRIGYGYRRFVYRWENHFRRPPDSEPNSQLLEILLSEKGRWEALTFASSICQWEVTRAILDTPKLKTLECDLSNFRRFRAPNLSRLRIRGLYDVSEIRIPTSTNVRHLHLNNAYVVDIHSISMVFPCLNTLVVDRFFYSRSHPDTRSYLKIQSMTLPIDSVTEMRPIYIAIFHNFHLPMLQNLILVGELEEIQVAHVMAALIDAPCRPLVIDFQPKTAIPLSEVDVGVAEPLLSIVEKVTLRGEPLCRRAPRNY